MIVKSYLLDLPFGFGVELPQKQKNKKNPLDLRDSRGEI